MFAWRTGARVGSEGGWLAVGVAPQNGFAAMSASPSDKDDCQNIAVALAEYMRLLVTVGAGSCRVQVSLSCGTFAFIDVPKRGGLCPSTVGSYGTGSGTEVARVNGSTGTFQFHASGSAKRRC